MSPAHTATPDLDPQPRQVRAADVPRSLFPPLAIAFVAVIIVSNICATKGVVLFNALSLDLGPLAVHGLVTDGAFWLFPLAYVLGDVISEVYGFRAMRRLVLWTFVVSIAVAAAFMITIWLPAAEFYANQAALESVVGTVPRILAASLAGFVAGELLNSIVLVKLKQATGEPKLWLRLMGSTVVGEFADTLLFCLIAAGAIGITTGSDLINYVVVGFVWKTLVEACMLPITYTVIAAVKRAEPTY